MVAEPLEDKSNDVFSNMPRDEALNVISQLPLEEIFNYAAVPKCWRVYAIEDENFRRRLRRKCETGLPPAIRGAIWSLLIGSTEIQMPRDVSYQELKMQESFYADQINRDVSRTFPTNFFFMFPHVQQTLYYILNANANYNKDVGYCQGMGLVAALLMFHMKEEDAFWALAKLSSPTSPFSLMWKIDPGLPKSISILQSLLESEFPVLWAHFEEENIEISSFTAPWFLTIFIHNFPLNLAIRIWDLFLIEGFNFVYVVALTIFRLFQDKLLKMKFDDLMMFLNFKDYAPVIDEDALLTSSIAWRETLKPIILKAEQESALSARRNTV